MNPAITKMMGHHKKRLNTCLILFFLLVSFINLLKQESAASRCVDYSDFTSKSYAGFVVDQDDNPDLLFNAYYATERYRNNKLSISGIKFQLNASALKEAIYYFIDKFFIIPLIFLPQARILKILQKKNICHKASDDKPAPAFRC